MSTTKTSDTDTANLIDAIGTLCEQLEGRSLNGPESARALRELSADPAFLVLVGSCELAANAY